MSATTRPKFVIVAASDGRSITATIELKVCWKPGAKINHHQAHKHARTLIKEAMEGKPTKGIIFLSGVALNFISLASHQDFPGSEHRESMHREYAAATAEIRII